MKKIVISGGHGDIAYTIRQKLEELGYKIFSPSRAEMDVTNIDNVNDYIGNIKPDIMINNAGYLFPQSIIEGDIQKEKLSIQINLFGTFNCTMATLANNSNAQIINIGSSAATKAHAHWSSYCATKAALVMATTCWAQEGINAICISPGRTATKMRKGLFPNENTQTLLDPLEFAKIIVMAVEGHYAAGTHLNVNVNNVKELINEAKGN